LSEAKRIVRSSMRTLPSNTQAIAQAYVFYMNRLGLYYWSNAQSLRAFNALSHCLFHHHSTVSSLEIGYTYLQLGRVALSMDEMKHQSLSYFHQADVRFKSLDLPRYAIRVLIGRARYFYDTEQFNDLKVTIAEARYLFEQHQTKLTWHEKAQLPFFIGYYEAEYAISHAKYADALDIFNHIVTLPVDALNIAYIYYRIACVYELIGDTNAYVTYLAQCEERCLNEDPALSVYYYVILARATQALHASQFQTYVSLLEDGVRYMKRHKHPLLESLFIKKLADFYTEQGKHKEANKLLLNYIRMLEQMNKEKNASFNILEEE
ncbi:MAG: hypothetical protein ACRC5C_06780, partial [Bacilli bacterium]